MEQNKIESIMDSLHKAVTETPGAAALCIVKQGPDQGPMVLIQTQDTNELIASVAAALKVVPSAMAYIKAALALIEEFDPKTLPNNLESGGIVTNEHSESGEYIVPVHKEFSGTMQPDPNIPPVKGILDIIKNDANTPVIKFVLKNGVLNLLDDEIYLSMPFEDGKIFYTNSQLRSDYKIKNLSLKDAHTIAKDAFEYVCQFSRTNGVASKYPIKGPACYEYCVQAKKSGQMVRIYKCEEVNEAPIKFTLNGNVLSIFDNDFPYTIQRGYIKRCIKHEVNNVPTFLECDFFYNNGDISTFTVSDERTYFYCSEAAEKALQVILCTK